MKTTEYLNAVKTLHSIESDYRLAKVLGLTQQALSNYRNRGTVMDATTALRVAELLNKPPLAVIADTEIERARRPEIKKTWMRYALGVALGITGFGMASAPAPADARPASAVYYVKSGRHKNYSPPPPEAVKVGLNDAHRGVEGTIKG